MKSLWSPKSLGRDIRRSFPYVMHQRVRRAIMLILLLSALCQFGVQSLLPVWDKEILHAQSDGLGNLVMTFGIGALIGSWKERAWADAYRTASMR